MGVTAWCSVCWRAAKPSHSQLRMTPASVQPSGWQQRQLYFARPTKDGCFLCCRNSVPSTKHGHASAVMLVHSHGMLACAHCCPCPGSIPHKWDPAATGVLSVQVLELPALQPLVLVTKCLLQQAGLYDVERSSSGGVSGAALAHMAAASLQEDQKVGGHGRQLTAR